MAPPFFIVWIFCRPICSASVVRVRFFRIYHPVPSDLLSGFKTAPLCHLADRSSRPAIRKGKINVSI